MCVATVTFSTVLYSLFIITLSPPIVHAQVTDGGMQRQELWAHIVKKEIPRMAKQFGLSRHIVTTSSKKVTTHPHYLLSYMYLLYKHLCIFKTVCKHLLIANQNERL